MIKVGDPIPSMTLTEATPDGPKPISTEALFAGKTAVLFAVPGAFTPTCSARHLPGFVQNVDAFKAKGVDTLVCMAVNDAFVLGAWARDQAVDGRIVMIADGSGALTRAMGVELDLTARGLGVRSQRFAAIVVDGKVSYFGVEEPGGFEVSKAEKVLSIL